MDTNVKPKVSIQMCTYNRAHFIKQAVESVLVQTFSDWELLILDDASTDNTSKVVLPYLKDKRIRYILNNQNLGITKNRNKGLSLSLGEYIAVLDSDDFWINPKKLEEQISFLDKNPSYAVVGTNMRIIDENGNFKKNIFYAIEDKAIRSRMLIKDQFCHSSLIFRNTGEVYDEGFPGREDYDLLLKIGLKNKFANLSTIDVAYRKHGNQSDSHNRKESLKLITQIIKKYKNNYPNYFLAYIVQILRILRG